MSSFTPFSPHELPLLCLLASLVGSSETSSRLTVRYAKSTSRASTPSSTPPTRKGLSSPDTTCRGRRSTEVSSRSTSPGTGRCRCDHPIGRLIGLSRLGPTCLSMDASDLALLAILLLPTVLLLLLAILILNVLPFPLTPTGPWTRPASKTRMATPLGAIFGSAAFATSPRI